MVLLPLGLFGALGERLIREEQRQIDDELRRLQVARLDPVVASIARFTEARAREMLRLAEALGRGQLAAALAERGLTRAVLVDPHGERLDPPPGAQASSEQRAFFARTRHLWKDPDRLVTHAYHRPADEGGGARPSQGWYRLYHEGGLTLLFWHRAPDGRLLLVEQDRIGMIAELIGELPDTTRGGDRVVVRDAGGDVVYQWGSYEPAEGEAPLDRRAVAPPLVGWSVELHAPPTLAGARSTSSRLGAVTAAGALALALLGLAVFCYREYGRELREARQRVSFVNQVSHELKTPLTSIRMYAELLEESLDADDPDDAARLAKLRVIVGESQRLSRLIGNVLSFARQRRGQLDLRRRPASVDRVIDEVVEQFAPALAGAGIAIERNAGAPDEVAVDRDALEQILGNLIVNVERYAATGGWLGITSRADGGRVTVEVADRGPGIPDGERERIFEPFHRIGGRPDDAGTGTGIGLAISRELARLHGGELRARDSAAGACFELTLDVGERP